MEVRNRQLRDLATRQAPGAVAGREVTEWQLQEENPLVPVGAKVAFPDFCETLQRYYGN